jgi:ribulose kinase
MSEACYCDPRIQDQRRVQRELCASVRNPLGSLECAATKALNTQHGLAQLDWFRGLQSAAGNRELRLFLLDDILATTKVDM